jgi:hypothetical protein
MAFALTKAYAYPVANSAAVPYRRAEQVIELEFTATANDVDLDIGDLAGTFWGAVDATTMGATVLTEITALYPRITGCIAIESVQLIDRVQSAAAGSNGEFAVAINATTLLPEISVNAADGETSWVIKLVCRLLDNDPGVTWSYST